MKKLELSKTEKKVISLISYETRESEFLWNRETKKADIINPEYVKKNRAAIKKSMKDNEVENIQQLFTKLNNEKKEAEKTAWEIERKRRREASDRDEVNRIIYRNAVNKAICIPTKKQASELVSFEDFGKNTSKARLYFLKNYLSKSLEMLWPLGTGAHENFFKIIESEKIFVDVDVVDDWDVYSSKTKYAAHHYTFNLHMPKNYSFAKIGGLLTIFKGRKIERAGMPVTWMEQSRGMEVKEIEGFLIRGFHIKKSKSVQTLEDAIQKVSRQRARTARQIRERRFWKSLSREQITEKLKAVWITASDSIAAGNCPAGTNSFKNRYENKNHYGNIGAVRGDELIAQANGEIYFIKRIFAHKFGIQL
jgi:hypothetical protein